MNFYRFSIAWSRVLPDGDIANINEDGMAYYDTVINKTLEYHLEPMVTMYHYDLPEALQRFGGLTNPLIAKYFKAYANLLFQRFGDRVKYWITFNEPTVFCIEGYGEDGNAPGLNANGVGEYLCGHNVIKSHALVYHLYRNYYFQRFKGQVGITLNTRFFYSPTNNTEDVEKAMQFSVRLVFTFVGIKTICFINSDFIKISAWLVRTSNFQRRRQLSTSHDKNHCKK